MAAFLYIQRKSHNSAESSELPQPTTRTSFSVVQSLAKKLFNCLQSPYHSNAFFPLLSKKPSQNLTDRNSSKVSGIKALVMLNRVATVLHYDSSRSMVYDIPKLLLLLATRRKKKSFSAAVNSSLAATEDACLS